MGISLSNPIQTKMLIMNLLQNIFNYILHFIIVYLICCMVIGAIILTVGLLAWAILYLGFGIAQNSDATNFLGGPGIGLYIAFIGSIPVAIIATLWIAPTEKNLERAHHSYLDDMGRPFGYTDDSINHENMT